MRFFISPSSPSSTTRHFSPKRARKNSMVMMLSLLLKVSLLLVTVSDKNKKNNNILVDACSDVLITPGASQDGSAMIAYNADDAALYGVLYHYPATQNNSRDEVLQVYDWDTGVSVVQCSATTRHGRSISSKIVVEYYYQISKTTSRNPSSSCF